MTTAHPLYLCYIGIGFIAALIFIIRYVRTFDRRAEIANYMLFWAVIVAAMFARGLLFGYLYPLPLDLTIWGLATVFNIALLWQLRLFSHAQRRGRDAQDH